MNLRTGEIEVKFDHQLLGKGARVFSHTDTSGEERHRTQESRWKKKPRYWKKLEWDKTYVAQANWGRKQLWFS